VALVSSTDSQKAAVTADTDEASEGFANEARRATEVVEAKRLELAKLIQAAHQPIETKPFEAFSACWSRYRPINDTVLALAVQNTNLKAQRLSFSTAADALDRMQAALNELPADVGNGAGCRAVTAALRILVLESPHIAEPRDEEMDEIEARMNQLDATVREELASLDRSAAGTALESARVAYADFQKVHAEVLDLSRHNSNVRSFAISLDRARKTAAECESLLSALQQAVTRDRFRATR
jgi:hypothetical protein